MNLIRKADMFGQSIGFEENESKTLKTVQGAIFTLIVLIITIVICFFFGQDLYLRTNPVSRLSQSIVSNSTVTVKDFPFFIIFTDPTGTIMPSDYFDVIYRLYTVDSNVKITVKQFNTIPCNSNNFTNFKNLLVNTPCEGNLKCVCIDERNNAFYNNDFASQNSQFLHIAIYPCDSTKRACPPNTNSVIKNFNIALLMPNSYVNSNNYLAPVEYQLKTFSYQFSDQLYKRIFISVTNNNFISDDGFLLESIRTIPFYKVGNIYSEVITYTPGATPIGAFTFSSSNIIETTNRSYMKVQELIAKIGGFFNALYIVTFSLSFHYIRFLYIRKIFSESYQIESRNQNLSMINTQSVIPRFNKVDLIKKDNFVIKPEIKPKEVIKEIKETKENFKNPKNSRSSYVNIPLENPEFKWNYLKYLLSYLCFYKSYKTEIAKRISITKEKMSFVNLIKAMNFFYSQDKEVEINR